jgi:type IV secretory pathway TraG/TraD family ATPase VirD4
MRKLLLAVLLALTAAAAVALGPGGWYGRGVREATARYHQVYVAAAWPPENAGIYAATYLKAHNRGAGGFYSLPKAGTTTPATPRLVSWGAWTRDPERQYARIHSARTDVALLRLGVMGELGGAALLLALLLSRPLWYVTTGMARLKPSKALGGAVRATGRDLRELRPTRRDAQIILGRLGRRVLALRGLEQYQSTLVVGPPRAGKSVGLFITNLLAERGPGRGRRLIERLQRWRMALTTTAAGRVDGQGDGQGDGDGGRVRLDRRIAAGMLGRVERRLMRRRLRGVRSLVITDLKGELTERTYAAMSRRHRCQVLNLVSPATSVGYNPLAHIRTALDAQVFAQTWIANTGQSSSEPFWDSAAKYLITAVVLHLNATMEGKDGGDGGDGEGATLTHVRKFLMLGSATIMGALTDSPHADVKEAMEGFAADLERNEKLQGSIFVELPLRFQLMADARVQATTGRNDIDFAAMASLDAEPIALYLVLDRRMGQELKPLTACFFTQMFNAVIEIADRSPGGMLPRSILGYLDEFGNLGRIYNFPTWMTTVRSAGMGFILAVQSLSQLDIYNDHGVDGKAIILEACNVKIALAKTTAEDAKWFSEQTGTATVLAANAGASRKRGAVLVDHGNQGYSETSRPLLTPGEVTRMATNTLLLLSGNRPPAVVTQVRWYSKRLGVFPTRIRRLGLLRLPGGATVPPAGPLRGTPLPVPAVAFALTAPPAATEATTTAGPAATTTLVPSATPGAGDSGRSAPPLGVQLQGIKRKRREGAAPLSSPVAVPAAAPRASEREWLDEETDDWRDDVARGWS